MTREDRIVSGGIALTLLLTTLVYAPGLKDYTLPPKLAAWQFGLLILCAFSLRDRPTWPANPVALPAAAYLLASLVSLVHAVDPVAGLVDLGRMASGLILVWLIAGRPASGFDLWARAVVAGATVSAVLGIGQHLDLLPWAIPSAGLPSGTLGFRNVAATVTIQTVPFAIWLAIRDERRRTLWLAALGVLIAFLLQTRTRGAWVGAACSAAVLLVLLRRTLPRVVVPWKRLLPICIAALAIGVMPSQTAKLGPQDIDEKKATVADALGSIVDEGGDRGRLDVWRGTLAMIGDRPLGVGLGNWSLAYPAYDGGRAVSYDSAPSRPHNDFLWIAAEAGIPGIAAFLWLLAAAMRSAVRSARRDPTGLAAFALASLTAVMVHACFSFPRDRATPALLFWFALGTIGMLESRRVRTSLMMPSGAAAAVAIAAALAVTGRLAAFESRLGEATAAERRGDLAAVVDRTEEALALGRFHPEAIQLRGYALNTLGRYAESVAHYDTHARYRPHDIQVLNGRAIALQNSGDLPGAEEQYRTARSLSAPSDDLDYNLATLLLQMRKPNDAVPLLERVVGRQPDAGAWFHLGNAHAMRGDTPAAIDALEKATALAPELSQAWVVLGELYAKSGRPDDAVDAYRKFLNQHRADDRYAKHAKRMIESLSNTEAP